MKIAVLLVLLASTSAPAAADTAPMRQVIQGEVVQLVSVQNVAEQRTLAPGESAAWDVRVSANRPDGELDLTLSAQVPPGVFSVQVAACSSEGRGCDDLLVEPTPLGAEPIRIGSQPAADTVWYRVSTELVQARQGVPADVIFAVDGHGEAVTTDGQVTSTQTGEPGGAALADSASLPDTGTQAGRLLAAAGAIAAVGALTRAARRTRSAGPS